MRAVFVGGVHGVGKTTACAEAATQLGICHATASGIIRQQRSSAIALNSKHVQNIAGNQDLLINGVNALRALGAPLLLDGHFSLLGSDGAVTPVEARVFKHLDLSAIVLFYDHPRSIADRLNKRDGNKHTEQLVKQLQEIEISTARATAKTIGVTCVELKAFDIHGLVAYLRSLAVLAISR
jgi:adenylate kinase